jgi:4'-phosphopantetheinyl transferase
LFLVDLDPPAERLARLAEHLDPQERARAERFVPEKVRRRFLCARGSLREILADLVDLPPAELRFGYGDQGKPFLDLPGDLRFNLSHSHERALVGATWGRDLGVDLEHLREGQDLRGLAERFFSEPERQALRRVPEPEFRREFLRVWTRKEAYLKARGTGLALPLGDFAVPLGDLRHPANLAWTRGHPDEAASWSVQEIPCGESYLGAVCVQGGDWRTEAPCPWPAPA